MALHTSANPAEKSYSYVGIDIAIAIADAATPALADVVNPIGKEGRTLPTIARGASAHVCKPRIYLTTPMRRWWRRYDPARD